MRRSLLVIVFGITVLAFLAGYVAGGGHRPPAEMEDDALEILLVSLQPGGSYSKVRGTETPTADLVAENYHKYSKTRKSHPERTDVYNSCEGKKVNVTYTFDPEGDTKKDRIVITEHKNPS